MREAGFYLVILLANIVQGITGFAGTILAMPFSVLLVGPEVARPVLNVLGLLSGVYVFAGNRQHVAWGELKRVLPVMAAGILAGLAIRGALAGREKVLYLILGVFVMVLAVQGLGKQLLRRDGTDAGPPRTDRPGPGDWALLAGAGLAHGMFVSGGPLLIGYLSRRVPDKTAFRATISTVWIALNGLILAADLLGGAWSPELVRVQLIAVPFLLLGMFLGGRLVKTMRQRAFMTLTYVLLLIAGVTLLAK